MRLMSLLRGVDVVSVSAHPDLPVSAIVSDSRRASPGCLFLCLPGSRMSSKDVSRTENRKLAAFPRLIKDGKWNTSFSKEFDAYFNDHFFLRDELLDLNMKLTSFTGTSLNNTGKVISGKDGWYFYARNNAYRNYHNLDLFSPGELRQAAEDLDAIAEICRKNGKKVYLFIIPDKHKIYGEYFPGADKINPDSGSRAIQLTGYLNSNTPVPVVYFGDTLINRKSDGLLYWKNDSHWNEYGAYIATLEMLRIIRQDHPALPLLSLPVFRSEVVVNGDLAPSFEAVEYPQVTVKPGFRIHGAPLDYAFHNTALFNKKGKYRVLFVRDSFAVQQLPMLGNVFAKMRCLWSDYVIKTDEMKHFKSADIVIFQCAERLLPQLLDGIHESRKNLEKEMGK